MGAGQVVEELIGRSVKDFQVVRLLAADATGATCEARHLSTKRRAIIKFFQPPAGDGGRYRARFDREVAAYFSLSHANLAPLLNYGVDGERPFLIVALIEGESLRKRTRGRPGDGGPAWIEVVNTTIAPVAAALGAAHRAGCAHGAVNPGSIWIADDGGVKLTQMGFASLSARPPTASAAGIGDGADYVSPEQRQGQHPPSPAVDQYALAVVALELLTGRRPEPDAPLDRPAGLPSPAAAVFRRAMARKPADRFPSIEGFVEALVEALAAPTSAMPVAAAPASQRRAATPWLLRGLAIGGLAVALVLSLLAVSLLTTMHGGATTTALVVPSATRGPVATPTPSVRASAPTSVVVWPEPATPIAASPATEPPTPTALPAAGPLAGEWFHNFGQLRLSHTGDRLTGSFGNAFTQATGTLDGTVVGQRFSGVWASAERSGTVEWMLSGDGTTFDGSFVDGDSRRWCGARAGAPFPNGCSFAGAWANRINDGSPCTMTLVRVNLQVTGSYCAGAVDGTITAHAGEPERVMLEGTWTVSDHPPGTFTLYALGYDARQFQGNWIGDALNEWCGWRDGSAAPEQCLAR